tara:strand:- start:617 stop:1651 length:1035 start_codon:yes stop_codon:yes gene_type:complete
MESNIQVLNPDGTINQPVSQDGKLMWEWILPNSTINYRVLTKPNGFDVGDDEVNFQIWCNNREYILQETDRTFARANDEKQQIYLQEIIDFSSGNATTTPTLSSNTVKNLDIDRLAVLVTSNNFNTDEKGIYEGTYKIPSNSTIGQYVFIISYGYDDDSRQGHNSRQKKVQKQIILAALVAIAIICVTVLLIQILVGVVIGLTGGGFVAGFGTAFAGGSIATALGATGGTLIAAEVALVSADYIFYEWLENEHDATGQFMLLLYGITDYPTTGKNESGCEFKSPVGELGPIIHTYGGVVAPFIEFGDDGEPKQPPLLSDNLKSALVVLATVATASILIGGGGSD